MGEIEEFAEALIDQLSVEISEEKEIAQTVKRIDEDAEFKIKFDAIEEIAEQLVPFSKKTIQDFWGIEVPDSNLVYSELNDFKILKAKKVFAPEASRDYIDKLFNAVAKTDRAAISECMKKDHAKYLVYSTYAKGYISKISTTYGDYFNSTIFLNKFILSSYPKIILYKQGQPYESNYELVKSGYLGALKMTILEEQIHSMQKNLFDQNKQAVTEVNALNEELAQNILSLSNDTTKALTEFLQLEPVPDEFPIAQRANLFFTLNPDNFIVNVLGPDVMTFTKVDVDPTIAKYVPNLLDIYQRWLKPIQTHHAAFSVMEGLAEFSVQKILSEDIDFQNYLTTFMGSNISAYQVRKSMGKDFASAVYEKLGKNTFSRLVDTPPTTKELKDPTSYLKRVL